MGMRERRRQRATAQAQVEAGLGRVTLSTLCTTQRAFVEVGLVWGDVAKDENQALQNLRRRALEHGCDAVLGLSLYSTGSERLFSARRRHDDWRAYGTGVRWLAD